MTELLDELARALARPMPRRRAIRVLAGALIGAMVPAARARAAPSTHDCPAQGAFLCKCPSINGLFYQVCCPNKTADVEYECFCKAPPNGYAQCRKVEEKRCGPDVTAALEGALSRVKSTFAGWSDARRFVACTNLVTLPGAAVSWDIRELGPGGRGAFQQSHAACKSCGYSVQVGNSCHYSGSVNYVAYGVMMRLCHDHFSSDNSSFADWYSREEMLELIYMHKNQTGTQAGNFKASNEWALAGYQSGSVRPTPPAERPECKPCPTGYSGRGFTVNWFPSVIRP